MKLVRLIAKNFGSHESIEIDFKGGLTLIDGWNHDLQSANGVGKTVFLNSIIYAIYGDVVKKNGALKISEIIREGADSMSTTIELETSKGRINIYRSRNPNHVKLSINGVMFEGTTAKVEAQILNVLDLRMDQFVQICYCYQKARDRFVELNDTQKKEFLTSILNLECYSSAYKIAHAAITDQEKRIAGLEGAISIADSTLQRERTLLQKVQEEERAFLLNRDTLMESCRASFSKWLKERDEKLRTAENDFNSKFTSFAVFCENVNPEIGKCETQIAALQEAKRNIAPVNIAPLLERKRDLQAQIDNANTAKFVLLQNEQKIRESEAKIDFYEREKSNPPDKCDECQQTLPTFDRTAWTERCDKHINNLRNSIQDLRELNKTAREVVDAISDLQVRVAAVDMAIEEEKKRSDTTGYDLRIYRIHSDIDKMTSTRSSFRAEAEAAARARDMIKENLAAQEKLNQDATDRQIEVLRTKGSNLRSQCVKQEARIAEVEAEAKTLRTKLNAEKSELVYLNECKRIFSPTGVRAYVFDAIVADLNARLEYYMELLFNGLVQFEYVSDEKTGKLIEKLTYRGKERSVAMLSGGEDSRLSLAVDFALSDVIASRLAVQPNILIMDEATQGLAADGRERYMMLLQELEKKRDVVFVVEHESEFKTNFTNVIQLELRDGITRRA